MLYFKYIDCGVLHLSVNFDYINNCVGWGMVTLGCGLKTKVILLFSFSLMDEYIRNT